MNEAYRIGPLLRARGWHLAVAESCTAGLLGYRITEVPGSSDYFVGGALTYTNALKRALLQVPEALLARRGAVSAPVALAMAQGARQLMRCEVALSITGIAGPGGGSPQKPVGLTYIGLAALGEGRVWRYVWEGDRAANRAASVEAALRHLVHYLR